MVIPRNHKRIRLASSASWPDAGLPASAQLSFPGMTMYLTLVYYSGNICDQRQ